jgi:hypothetical protein
MKKVVQIIGIQYFLIHHTAAATGQIMLINIIVFHNLNKITDVKKIW